MASDGLVYATIGLSVAGTLVGTDVDSGNIVFSVLSNGTLGTAVITDTATGAFTYTPTSIVPGTDSFTFIITDENLTSNIATVRARAKITSHFGAQIGVRFEQAE